MLTKAVFFDRDDTLIQDTGYMYKIADFKWIDGAIPALSLLRDAHIPIFIATNQGGIGKGLFTLEQMQHFHNHLRAEALRAGIPITDIAFCPHHPDAVIPEFAPPCSCRKPQPGMLQALAAKWQIDLNTSVMIGDRETDLEAGKRAGCTSLQLTSETDLPSLVSEAIKIIDTEK